MKLGNAVGVPDDEISNWHCHCWSTLAQASGCPTAQRTLRYEKPVAQYRIHKKDLGPVRTSFIFHIPNVYFITRSVHFFRCVRKISKSHYQLCHARLSAWSNSALTGWIFTKFGTCVFSENLSRKFKFH